MSCKTLMCVGAAPHHTGVAYVIMGLMIILYTSFLLLIDIGELYTISGYNFLRIAWAFSRFP